MTINDLCDMARKLYDESPDDPVMVHQKLLELAPAEDVLEALKTVHGELRQELSEDKFPLTMSSRRPDEPRVLRWLWALSVILEEEQPAAFSPEEQRQVRRELDYILMDWEMAEETDLDRLRRQLGVHDRPGRPRSRRRTQRHFEIALAYMYRRAAGEKQSAAMAATMIEFSCSEDTVQRATRSARGFRWVAQSPPLNGEERLAWFCRAVNDEPQ